MPGSLVGVLFPTVPGGLVHDDDRSFEPTAVRAARRLSEASIAWTLVGSSVAVAVGVASGSAALVAFGAVGYVDLVGSVALVHHFRHALLNDELSDRFEQRAQRIVTIGLLAVGLCAVVISAVRLSIGHFPTTSSAAIAIAAISLVGLSVFAVRKVQIARVVPSAALRSDGNLSAVGAAQAAVVLVGTGAARLVSWHWADDTAALVVGVVAVAIATTTLLSGDRS